MTSRPEDSPPLNITLKQLEWNLDWLQQMEQNEPTEYYRDAALQRLEFTFQTALKCIRQAAALPETAPPRPPEEYFEIARRQSWIPESMPWRELLEDYRKIKSGAAPDHPPAVFTQIKQYREGFRFLYDRLNSLASES